MRIVFATLFAAALVPTPVSADFGRWSTGGPPERWIAQVAVAPSDPAVLYAVASSGQLYASEAGTGWQLRSTLAIRGVAVHPSISSVLYGHTATEILRSTDGGRSWHSISAFPLDPGSLSAGIETLVIAPSDPSVLYAGAAGNVFRSSNGGISWEPTALRARFRQTGTHALVVHPRNPSVVYAAAYSLDGVVFGIGFGVLRTEDGGTTWTASLFELPPNLLIVRWVLLDPSNPAIAFAGGLDNVIHRSIDAGQTFSPITLDPGVGRVTSLAVSPATSREVYAATSQLGVLKSDNGGFTFSPFNCSLPHLTMTAIVFRPDGRGLHVGTRWGGVYDYGFFMIPNAPPCPQGDVMLCLQAGRFCVRMTWRASDGRSGIGQPVTFTSDTGAFWFFDSSNLEVMLKVLDGTRINGHFWVFYGSLSNVEYVITVTDNETGRIRTYRNNQGQVASVTDTEAF